MLLCFIYFYILSHIVEIPISGTRAAVFFVTNVCSSLICCSLSFNFITTFTTRANNWDCEFLSQNQNLFTILVRLRSTFTILYVWAISWRIRIIITHRILDFLTLLESSNDSEIFTKAVIGTHEEPRTWSWHAKEDLYFFLSKCELHRRGLFEPVLGEQNREIQKQKWKTCY